MKTKENDKEGWALDVSAASKFPNNAVEEFGGSSDPFEKVAARRCSALAQG